jgi:hypothetical protein
LTQTSEGYVTGFTTTGRDWMYLLPTSRSNLAAYVQKKTIPHEAAHILDGKAYKYSFSKKYLKAVKADNLFNGEKWPSEYAEYSFNQRVIKKPYSSIQR